MARGVGMVITNVSINGHSIGNTRESVSVSAYLLNEGTTEQALEVVVSDLRQSNGFVKLDGELLSMALMAARLIVPGFGR